MVGRPSRWARLARLSIVCRGFLRGRIAQHGIDPEDGIHRALYMIDRTPVRGCAGHRDLSARGGAEGGHVRRRRSGPGIVALRIGGGNQVTENEGASGPGRAA